jgi:hypothetical protein
MQQVLEPQLPFAGMAREMERLSLAFAKRDPLLLLGPQGSGKTRLIQEALSRNRHVLYIADAVEIAGFHGDGGVTRESRYRGGGGIALIGEEEKQLVLDDGAAHAAVVFAPVLYRFEPGSDCRSRGRGTRLLLAAALLLPPPLASAQKKRFRISHLSLLIREVGRRVPPACLLASFPPQSRRWP